MNIEKLCKEFHEKVGKDKTLKIVIEEGNVQDKSEWFIGKMRPEVLDEIRNMSKPKKLKPFFKLSKGNGVEYRYICFKQE